MAVPLFASDQGIYRDLPDVRPAPHRARSSHERTTKRLYRIRDGRVVAGVCAGLAAYFGVDPTLVRLAFALLTLFGGLGVLLYLGAWVVIPDEVDGTSIAETIVNKRPS
jgi:phage shock protein PspC (stress-responsive transcriptional regulator)